jgi:hypothetical protein
VIDTPDNVGTLCWVVVKADRTRDSSCAVDWLPSCEVIALEVVPSGTVIVYSTNKPPLGDADTSTITFDAETPFPAALAICSAIAFPNAVIVAELPRMAAALFTSTDRLPETLVAESGACTLGLAVWDAPVTDTPATVGTLCWVVAKAVWTRDTS